MDYPLQPLAPIRAAKLAFALIALTAALVVAACASASAESFGAAAWGNNSSGQLGNGSTLKSAFPTTVSALDEVIAVAAGGEHDLALLSDGTVMAWGANHHGQLGNGTTTNSDVPVPVEGLSEVTAVAAGAEFSLALLANGTVMSWGANEEGELGNGTSTESDVPVAVKGLTGVKEIAAGRETGLALLTTGAVMAWGSGEEGQLGNGKSARSEVPVGVKGLTSATAVAAGAEQSLALLSNGTVMSWGSNAEGQLGNKGIKEQSNVPVAVEGLTGASAVAAGEEHSLALLTTGTVKAWGANHQGQLGDGAFNRGSGVPVPVSDLSEVSAIAAGARHNLALLSSGNVMAWGYNGFGQLGNGILTNADVPVAVSSLHGVAGISAGSSSSLSFGAPLASVTGLEPASGPTAGGTHVTITGTNLGEVTAVHFGTNEAESFEIESPTSITAVAPPGTGVVNVTVISAAGTSAPGPASQFTYVPPPVITKISPKKGPAAGGTHVTITGTNLGEATAVHFGASEAESFEINSPASITAVSPPETTGTVDITITSPDGTSSFNQHDRYKFEAPTVTSVEPDEGPTEGGTIVTIHGSGFGVGFGGTTFKFGKAFAEEIECTSSSTCMVLTPSASKPQTIDVKATVHSMSSKKNPPGDQFTYN